MEKENLSNESTCPTCGKPIPEGAPQGMCPACLMDHASLATETSVTGDMPQQPPSLETMRAVFPDLEIDSLVGQGGMGFVYKARQSKLDRWVALKVLSPSLAQNPDFAKRFEREAKLLARLNHPNIVAVYDFGRQGDFFFLLMEFVEGVNLREAMRTEQFKPQKALAIVPNICEALQFAHDEGVLHRDIKPENILLDTKGRIKIADFGIAKMLDDGPTAATGLTKHGASIGTPHYMAPEQIENPADVDHRADIYSLGVVFYELLTGELPLGRFGPPSEKSGADAGVDDIVFQALAKEKEHRQQKVSEVKTQVESVSQQPNVDPKSSEPSNKTANEHHEVHTEASDGWKKMDPKVRQSLLGLLGLVAWILSIYFMYPKHHTEFSTEQTPAEITNIWTFGGGDEPWLELRRTPDGSGFEDSYRYASPGGGFKVGIAAMAVWALWIFLAMKEWGRGITCVPLGRGSKFSQEDRRKRFFWVAITQHLFMALITFLLFGLLVAFYGGKPPIPLFPFFVVNQFMAVVIYACEWSLAQRQQGVKSSRWHFSFQRLSPKGLTVLIVLLLITPPLLWIIGTWHLRQSEATAHRNAAKWDVMQEYLKSQVAMYEAKIEDNQNELDRWASLVESETDPNQKQQYRQEYRQAILEQGKVKTELQEATKRFLNLQARPMESSPSSIGFPKAMVLTFLVPIGLIWLSLYGWRILNRVRRGEMAPGYILPGLVAALPLPFLLIDAAVGALVLMPFNHGVWVNAGISLSIIAIIAVDVWLIKHLLSWIHQDDQQKRSG